MPLTCPLTPPPRQRRGNGANGQLGAGAPAPSNWLNPQTSPQFVGADSIHAGSLSTCIITGLGKRICTGSNAYGQLASSTLVASINTSPLETVIPASGPLAGSTFALPPPFVVVSDAANAPVCLLQLSVKVDATCDNTPPVFDPALADLKVDATSAAGAVVTYDPPANNDGIPVTVTCTPASGSQFAIGTTPVTCTAGVTTGTFNVRARGVLARARVSVLLCQLLEHSPPQPSSTSSIGQP